jgi:7-cyano-7-deazaguanine reductase
MADLTKLTELGKSSNYSNTYAPQLLVAVPRQNYTIPQHGIDVWRSWETSWLDHNNKPQNAIIDIAYDANSPYIVESKSLKLYLGSLNFTPFTSPANFLTTIMRDISYIVGSKVSAKFIENCARRNPSGDCIDSENIEKLYDTPRAALLEIDNKQVQETLYTDLFRSCCPVTSQPDWASIVIEYKGNKIIRNKLLSYLLSYRNHSGFHESCVSEIFNDIAQYCNPNYLTVQGYFTRRGGIDINPLRSSFSDYNFKNIYLPRQ